LALEIKKERSGREEGKRSRRRNRGKEGGGVTTATPASESSESSERRRATSSIEKKALLSVAGFSAHELASSSDLPPEDAKQTEVLSPNCNNQDEPFPPWSER
jgi:hypothetical protein